MTTYSVPTHQTVADAQTEATTSTRPARRPFRTFARVLFAVVKGAVHLLVGAGPLAARRDVGYDRRIH